MTDLIEKMRCVSVPGFQVRRAMRLNHITIRQIARAMQITQKRVRQVRAEGVSGISVLDWRDFLAYLADSDRSQAAQEAIGAFYGQPDPELVHRSLNR